MADYVRFAADLDAFAAKIKVDFKLVLKKIALAIFTGIVRRTPVDTGVARASWVIGVNNFPAPADLHLGKGGKLSPGTAQNISMEQVGKLNVPDPFSIIIISNYLPYIQKLENGSSKQAPAGMVRLSIEEEFARIKVGQP